ncbi:bifunctional glycosyltransferase/CDP-glycerol:glycerophosphate glycerophosphotransferase [Yinghuangia soli]|uniref:Bifunctional glycosyltransferase family 2 protein/CDP-glycerol:glycerophosphate glycerophosphotransferase n=1 Tax=Yinghuangia soli TaxID=2908204 RepID=A0AA41PW49_9ACTN|nr:CDP-glycerol glycerophosphotransferase family protein [Yinghuangia soli]MCF2526833.1 bifunctional glycosyltransferase family 2 protein/CDP-glycerol:glycerophosphate glycerophosphotransferase [Yinghuangia soli]
MSANRIPDVTVVVVVYDDAERLPIAVRSVLAQTLDNLEILVVDDHSPDDSYAVAQALAAEHPGKIRAIQLPENSGSGGGPRNAGIEAARGRYLMFLDSDDTLDRHACLSMLAAAEETGADLVSARVVRVHQDKRNKVTQWHPWLYETSRVMDSVLDEPDLVVWDTLSTNKCYRRDFLLGKELRYPTGVVYEDLLFAAEAWLAAERIAIIPNIIYYWNVVERTDRPSVTNRRHEIKNLLDRLEIHRRIDALFARQGEQAGHELKVRKDTKFLKHDLVLHVRDLPHRDEEYRGQFADAVADYLDQIEPEAYQNVGTMHGVCALLTARRDWDDLLPAADSLMNPGKATVPLHVEDGRVYWCDRYLDSAWHRELLDVTELGFHTMPLQELSLGNRLTRLTVEGDEIRFSGSVANVLGRIPADAELTAVLQIHPRRGMLRGRGIEVPVTLRHAGGTVEWEAAAELGRRVHPVGVLDKVWDVRFRLKVDGTATVSGLTIGDVPLDGVRVPVLPITGPISADRFQAVGGKRGELEFWLDQESAAARRSHEFVHRFVNSPSGETTLRRAVAARSLGRKLTGPKTKAKAYAKLFMKLPIRKGTVVFESHMGKQYSDSPKYIYEEMRRAGVPFEGIWSYSGKPTGFPKDAKLVRRGSLEYYRALAQAEFWIDNQGFPRDILKRPETTYIQTWHGSALKNMGDDVPAEKRRTQAQRAATRRMLDRFDYFVTRSQHDADTLVRAFGLRAEVLPIGYPRNDALVDRGAGLAAELRELRTKLRLDDDRRVLLYAPTFRQDDNGAVEFEMPFDLERFGREFGRDWILLVRTHYLDQFSVPPGARDFVRNVSGVHDITPLLLTADALVTDYSSVMFDYALLDRPMFFYAYDYEAYTQHERGTYFDLREAAPGPFTRDEDELFAALRDFDAARDDYADARRDFVRRFGEFDTGTAAKALVQRFFPTGPATEEGR